MSDAPATITPKALAAEIGVDPKVLRAHLRKTFSRPAEAKNTSWLIPTNVAKATKTHFEALKAKATPKA